MLTEIEFKDVKHIVLDKKLETIIMNRNKDYQWLIHEIPKDTMVAAHKPILVDEETAYLYYMERMQSFGFLQFPVLIE